MRLFGPSCRAEMTYPPEEIHRRYRLREEFEPMTFRRRIAHENFAPGLSGKQEHTTTGKQRKDSIAARMLSSSGMLTSPRNRSSLQ